MIGLKERKAIHIAAGAGFMLLTYINQQYLFYILFILFIGSLLAMHKSKEGTMKFLLPGLAAPTLNYVSGLCIAFPLLEIDEFRAIIIALAISDSIAALFGKIWPIKTLSNGKSIGGALAFFSTCLLSFIFLPFPTFILFSFLLAIVELYTSIDDNLVLPVLGSIFLYIL